MVAPAGRKFVSSFLFVASLCAVHASGCDGGGSPGKTGTAGTSGGGAGTSGGTAGTSGGGAGTSGGGAGTTGGGAGTSGAAAGTTGGAAGTVGAAGTTGGAAGTKGTAGTGAAGTSGGGGTGAGSGKPAVATLVQANGNGFQGTGTFTADAMGFITLTLMIKNCGNTTHGVHLNMNPDCGNDALNSGMPWTPKGNGLPDITCAGGGGGMGMMTYKTPSAGYWTIGTGDATSDILMRSLVVYQGPDTKPGNPIGCGVPRTD